MDNVELDREKELASKEIKSILDELSKIDPSITEGIAAALGSALGAGGSLAALSFIGAVSGLSAAGITSGLAAAGSIVGGGMAAGIGVLAAPVAILGVAGYAIAKSMKNSKSVAALNTAIMKLYKIQSKLAANAKYFQAELNTLNIVIGELEKKLNERK